MNKFRFRQKTTAQPARDVLFHVLRKLGLKSVISRVEINAAWKQLVGEAMNTHTVIYSFSNYVLTVKCSPGAWQNELSFMRNDLVIKLNEHFGKQVVKELRIISGHIEQPSLPSPNCIPDPKNPLYAAALARHVEDPVLREAFERAIQKGLGFMQ